MQQYINKATLVAEIEKELNATKKYSTEYVNGKKYALKKIISFLDTLEVKEMKEPASTFYVVTRCEEHSDYVEEVFFNKDKAQEYCDQFKGNENEYARHITKVKVQKGE